MIHYPEFLRNVQVRGAEIVGDFVRGVKGFATNPPWLFRDEFSVDHAAPLSTARTCEPGPGALYIVDPNQEFSISDSLLKAPIPTIQYAPRVNSSTYYNRAEGLSLRVQQYCDYLADYHGMFYYGVSPTVGVPAAHSAIIYTRFDYSLTVVEGNSAAVCYHAKITTGNHSYHIILRGQGSFYLFDNELIWVSHKNSLSPVWMICHPYGPYQPYDIDSIKVSQLASPWDTSFGIATSYIASAPADTIINHEMQCIIDVQWTAVTGHIQNIRFYRNDDNNCFIIRCTQSTSTIKLIEVTSGVETERSSAAQTWSNGTSYRVTIVTDKDDANPGFYTIYSHTVATATTGSPVYKNSYYSAIGNYTTAKISEASSYFISWPVVLSADQLAALNSGADTIYDDFTTTKNAPVSDNILQADPGPGSMTIIDYNNTFNIQDGSMVPANQIESSVWFPYLVTNGYIPHSVGLAISVRYTAPAGQGAVWNFGFTQATSSLTGYLYCYKITSPTSIGPLVSYTSGPQQLLLSDGSENILVVVVRSHGAFFIMKRNGIWELCWLYSEDGYYTQNLLGCIFSQPGLKQSAFDNLTIANLQAPFNAGYGFATDYAITSPYEIDHDVDGFVELNCNFGPGLTYRLMFRRTDNNNCWIAQLQEGAADTIKLYEVNAGVETQRASTTVSMPTSIAPTGIICVFYGDTIIVGYNRQSNGALTYTTPYTSSFNNTATNAYYISGMGFSYMASYPRYLPANAVAELERWQL